MEAFELGYYHKHAFNSYHSRFYQGLPWGVSSLPRYLGLPGVHPRPPPAAMALNRRSRSLDNAESLELELQAMANDPGMLKKSEVSSSGREEKHKASSPGFHNKCSYPPNIFPALAMGLLELINCSFLIFQAHYCTSLKIPAQVFPSAMQLSPTSSVRRS